MPCRQAKLLVPVLLLKSSRRSCANDAPCRCKGRVDADRSHLVDTITMNVAVCSGLGVDVDAYLKDTAGPASRNIHEYIRSILSQQYII